MLKFSEFKKKPKNRKIKLEGNFWIFLEISFVKFSFSKLIMCQSCQATMVIIASRFWRKKIQSSKELPASGLREACVKQVWAQDLAQAYVLVLLKTLAQITVGSLMQFEITCRGLVLCWPSIWFFDEKNPIWVFFINKITLKNQTFWV